MRIWLVAAGLCMVAGCGGGEDGRPDAAVADGGDGGGDASADAEPGLVDAAADAAVLTEPRLAEPPVLTPCPTGWSPRPPKLPDHVVTCEPWPAQPASCPSQQARFPGDPSCALVGTTCPAGDFATNLPAGVPIIYVRKGNGRGDGSLASPFGKLADAMAVAGPGSVLALDKSTFDEAVVLRDGVVLWGACPGLTVLAASSTSTTAGTIQSAAASARVQNLSVGGARVGIWVTGGSLTLEDVIIRDALAGVRVDAGTLTARQLVVRDPAAGTAEARALDVRASGTVSVTRGAFLQSRGLAVLIGGPTARGILDQVAIDSTLPLSIGEDGRGALVAAGGALTFNRSVVERMVGRGIDVNGAAGQLIMTDMLLRDVRARPPIAMPGSSTESGLGVEYGAAARVERTTIERVPTVAIQSDGQLDLVNVAILSPGNVIAINFDGAGLWVVGGNARLSRVLLAETGSIALLVAGGVLEGSDVSIIDAKSSTGVEGGGALAVLGSGRATLRGVRLLRMRHYAAAAFGDPVESTTPMITLEDALVDGVGEAGCVASAWCPEFAGYGTGLGAFGGGQVKVTRFRVARTLLTAVHVGPGSAIDLMDGEVSSNPVGATVQEPTFDHRRLAVRVRYVDNGSNLETTSLPLPSPPKPEPAP